MKLTELLPFLCCLHWTCLDMHREGTADILDQGCYGGTGSNRKKGLVAQIRRWYLGVHIKKVSYIHFFLGGGGGKWICQNY